jgi:hypothetical protein
MIAFAVAAFLVVSFAVARWLTQDNRERGAVTDLLRAQGRGDAAAMFALLEGCAQRVACRTAVERNAATLEGPGAVQIVGYDSSTARATGDRRGPTRVAWTRGTGEAVVVQCVTVERRGLPLLGADIELSAIGRPIAGERSCPR